MLTKHLFVLIKIRNEGDVGRPTVKHLKHTDRSKAALLFWIRFIICVSCLSVILSCLFLQPYGNLLGKG